CLIELLGALELLHRGPQQLLELFRILEVGHGLMLDPPQLLLIFPLLPIQLGHQGIIFLLGQLQLGLEPSILGPFPLQVLNRLLLLLGQRLLSLENLVQLGLGRASSFF
ncbi:hypothetical protein CFOL_v3_16484, partial [Cephalotus follicularis]